MVRALPLPHDGQADDDPLDTEKAARAETLLPPSPHASAEVGSSQVVDLQRRGPESNRRIAVLQTAGPSCIRFYLSRFICSAPSPRALRLATCYAHLRPLAPGFAQGFAHEFARGALA